MSILSMLGLGGGKGNESPMESLQFIYPFMADDDVFIVSKNTEKKKVEIRSTKRSNIRFLDAKQISGIENLSAPSPAPE